MGKCKNTKDENIKWIAKKENCLVSVARRNYEEKYFKIKFYFSREFSTFLKKVSSLVAFEVKIPPEKS